MALTKEDLQQFTGSEVRFKHTIHRRLLYTEGVKFLAEEGKSYWLIDEIAILNMTHRRVQREEFQVWKLELNECKSSSVLTCGDGNNSEIYKKTIPFTDFPPPEVTLWFSNNVLMLPSEY